MIDDLTVRDVMTREFVGVNEGDTVAGAADLMVQAGTEGAVVLRGSEPLGLLDARDVVALVAAGSDADGVSAGAAVSDAGASIGPDVPLREAIATFAALDARRLVVVDETEVLGTLSEHDVVAALATVPDAGAAESPLGADTGEAIAEDSFSSQGVCEACGSLADRLANVNGQLLCVDCREMSTSTG